MGAIFLFIRIYTASKIPDVGGTIPFRYPYHKTARRWRGGRPIPSPVWSKGTSVVSIASELDSNKANADALEPGVSTNIRFAGASKSTRGTTAGSQLNIRQPRERRKSAASVTSVRIVAFYHPIRRWWGHAAREEKIAKRFPNWSCDDGFITREW
jgi:hypothetical protein